MNAPNTENVSAGTQCHDKAEEVTLGESLHPARASVAAGTNLLRLRRRMHRQLLQESFQLVHEFREDLRVFLLADPSAQPGEHLAFLFSHRCHRLFLARTRPIRRASLVRSQDPIFSLTICNELRNVSRVNMVEVPTVGSASYKCQLPCNAYITIHVPPAT